MPPEKYINLHIMNDLEEIFQLADKLSDHLKDFKVKSIYDINLFEKPKIEEPHISYLLYRILDYEGKDGKITYKRFIKTFFPELKEQINTPEITFEKAYHIDILIKDKNYAIIIENKIFGAEFQRNQLARYIRRVLNNGYSKEQIHIVIIPPKYEEKYLESIRDSVWRLPPDWEYPNQYRECAEYDQYICSCDVSENACNKKTKCIDMSEFKKRTKIIDNVKIAGWLEECLTQIDQKERLLCSSIIQVSDYIQHFNCSKMKMEAQKFLKDKINTLATETNQDKLEFIARYLTDLEVLQETLKSIKEKPSRELIGTWAKEIKKNGWNISEEQDVFYLEIQIRGIGIRCGCWSGCGTSDTYFNSPYCGFLINTPSQNNQELNDLQSCIKEVVLNAGYLDDFQYNELGKSTHFICYMGTFNGDEVCKKLFTAAKDLGYLGEELKNI